MLEGVSTVGLLVVLIYFAKYIPRWVEFDFPNDQVSVRYALSVRRFFRLGELEKVVYSTNSWEKDPSVLLHFHNGRKLLMLCEDGDNRVDQVVALLRNRIEK